MTLEKKSEDRSQPFDPIAIGSAQGKPEPVSETNSQRFPEDKQAPATKELQTKNDKPETGNMEFHHQLHHAPGKKKHFKHYLFEFLMLFLAITLGFFVENQREHYVEHQREKQFMRSMVDDLQKDTANFNGAIADFTLINNHIDSLIPLLQDYNNLERNAKQIYQHAVWLHYYYKITYADRTIEQLKNSGNFRLIRNKKVSSSILEYDGRARNNIEDMQNTYVYQNKEKMLDRSNGIFKTSVVKKWSVNGWRYHEIELPPVPFFLSTERAQIDRFVNELNQYSLAITWFITSVHFATERAQKLDLLIRKEYHLE